jgi:exosortase/archaeosortase family protein
MAAAARALAVLALGFALADSAAGRAFGDAVATTLAVLATPFLQMLDPGILRTGTELRGMAGWAVRVSEVCDGHGLAISLAAGLAALSTGRRQVIRRLIVGLLAIQVFNLARIVVLAAVLSAASGAFDIVHLRVFPYLTVALLAVLVLPMARALPLLALSLVLVLLWLPLADVAASALVPAANLILSVLAGPEVGQIAERAAGWTIGSTLLAGEVDGQARLFLAPLRPADFALSVPVVLAAVALTRRPLWLVPAVMSMLLALTLAAVTSVWTLAAAQSPATLLVPDGAGAYVTQDFIPSDTLRAVLQLAQSTLVHLNLLVLPFLIAAHGRKTGKENRA